MARTNATAVQTILDSNWNQTSSVAPYMEMATALTDRVVACASARNKALTATEAELVERWLSAFYYCLMDPTYQSKTTASAGATFQGQGTLGLNQNRYGQGAMIADPSGCLRTMNNGKARFFWGGKRASEQVPIDQRE